MEQDAAILHEDAVVRAVDDRLDEEALVEESDAGGIGRQLGGVCDDLGKVAA